MEFFHNVNMDWMGKAKYFVSLSLVLLAVGWISILHNGGLRYGIDFRGGTLVYVRFSGPAPVNQIRKGLQDAGLANSSIQTISDNVLNGNSQNDVVIGIEKKGEGDEALDASKQAILDVLHKTFGTANTAGKQDFNSITPSSLAAYLTQKDPFSLGTNANDRYNQLAQRLTNARDKEHGGIVTNFDELKNVDGVTSAVIGSLSNGFTLSHFTFCNVEIVGPQVGAQLRRQAILATLYA